MVTLGQGLRHNPLIIGDSSRFEYNKSNVRTRSRNPSPLEYSQREHQPPYQFGLGANHGPTYNVDLPENSEESQNYISPHSSNFMPPYPNAGMAEAPPRAPSKDEKYYGHRHTLHVMNPNDLPAVQDLRDYMANQNLLVEKSRKPDNYSLKLLSHNSLVDRVMNKPLVRIGPRPNVNGNESIDEIRPYVVSSSTLCEVLQVMFSIVVTTLASVLLPIDLRISSSIFRYFIAAGVMSLVVALLFVSKTVRYEKRNAAVFCTLACVFTGVSLVLAIATFASDSNCATKQICSMRKALATLSILSFLLWMGSTIVYVTTLYISHMDGHSFPPTYTASDTSTSVPSTPRRSNLPLYYRSKKGEVFP